ncbi:hypothetical protein ACQPWY_36645 [Pseudonocardia xinjiangensis]|uniref:hypothetical protein n=1 Tax=Pseudonocardia xinjiangensis TaxID=75289 RepID=UPI003D9149AB
MLRRSALGQWALGQRVLRGRALGERVLRSRALRHVALGQWPLRRRALRGGALGQRAVGKGALRGGGLGQGVLRCRALGRGALGQRVVGLRVLRGRALGERVVWRGALRRGALGQRAVGQRVLRDSALGERVVWRGALRRGALGQRAVGQRVLRDSALGERVVRQRALGRSALGLWALGQPVGTARAALALRVPPDRPGVAQGGGVVVGDGRARGEDLDGGRDAGPFEDDGELVGEHVGGPGPGLDLHQHHRMRQGPGCRAGGRQAVGDQDTAALQLPGRHGQQGGGHDVIGRTGLEQVLGGAALAGRGKRGLRVEIGACGASRSHESCARGRGKHNPGGHQARGEDLDGVGVLADRDQFPCPGEQVVVHSAGQRQQQVVRRLR